MEGEGGRGWEGGREGEGGSRVEAMPLRRLLSRQQSTERTPQPLFQLLATIHVPLPCKLLRGEWPPDGDDHAKGKGQDAHGD